MSSVSSASITAGNPTFVDKYLKVWVPLLTPAVTSNGFEIHHDLLKYRMKITLVVWSVLTMPKGCPVNTLLKKIFRFPSNEYLALAAGTITFLALVILPAILITIFDERKAQKIVDENTVNAYLRAVNPPAAALRHIANNLSAAQLLVERGGDLNKQDEAGWGLLSIPGMDINVFKFFVDRGCNLLNGLVSGFMNAVTSNNPEYLRYLIQNNRISPDDYNTIRSFATPFWGVVQHRDVADLLLRMGLDINARGTDGRTPLGRLLFQERGGMPDFEAPLLTRAGRIAILRERGAQE